MLEDFIIGAAINTLLVILGDPKKHGKFRRAFLKVFKAIAEAYRMDQEFHDTAEKGLNS